MIQRIGWLAVAVACGAVFSGGTALAAGAGDPVTLSLTVGVEYTDNRDSTADKEDTFDFRVTPRIDAFLRGERLTLNFFYEPVYRYRTDPGPIQNESALHHDVGLNLDLKATPNVEFFARERFNVTDDPAIVEQGTTLRRDSSYNMNRAELGGRWLLTPLSRINISGRHRTKMYEERAVARESDEDLLGAEIQYWHQMTRTLGMSLSGVYEEFDFKSGRGLERGFSAVSAGASLEKVLGAALRAAVWAGYKELNYDDADLGRDSAPYVNALLRVEAHPGLRLNVRGGYTLRESGVYPYVSQTHTSGGLDANWRMSARWSLDVGGVYRISDYDADSTPVNATDPSYVRPVVGGEEKALILWGVASFAVNDATSLRLRQQYEDVDSDVSAAFTRHATRLELAKTF